MNNPKGPGALTWLGIGIIVGVIITLILIYVLGARPNEVSVGPIKFGLPNATAVTSEPVEPASEPALSGVISTVKATQIVEKPVVQSVVVEKSVPQTVIVEKVVTQIVEKPVTVVVEKPVEKQVTVPVPQTVVVAPSATPLPPTPAVTLPFEDNFNGSMKPEWSIVTGEWRFLNQERLIPVTRDGSLSVIRVGDPGWRNYAIDLDYFDCSDCQIWVRSPRPGDGLIYTFGNFTGNSWQVCRDSRCDVLTGFGKGDNTAKLRIEVLDDSFSASINGVRRLAITDSTYDTGAIAIGVTYKAIPQNSL